jgi:hypothetical protein
MTDIQESTDVLTINYRRGWASRILHLFVGLTSFAFAVGVLIVVKSEVPKGEYADFATPFLMIMELASLATAYLFISRIFDTIKYHFDKTADEFFVSGRKYFFKNWLIEGMTSEIIGITHEVRETHDNTSSEIYLKFRRYASVTETLKCGTRDVSEDNNIADVIERFLKRKNSI